MNEYDAQILRGVERDGVRMASGQHINQPAPHTRHRLIVKCETCGITGGHMVDCPDKYPEGYEPPVWADRRDHYDR